MAARPTTYLVLQQTDDSPRRLVPGQVIVETSDRLEIEFAETLMNPAPDAKAELLLERSGRLFQQHTRVVTATATLTGVTICFATIGAPVSADSRESFRVTTDNLPFFARFENERHCQIIDLSGEGLAILAPNELVIGEVGRLRLEYEGVEIDARVRVQSVRLWEGKMYRCGLRVPSSDMQTRSALRQLTSLIQRAQLHHLRDLA